MQSQPELRRKTGRREHIHKIIAEGHHRSSRPLALSLVCVGVAARLLPHWPDFTPIGTSGLFAGARLRGWRAYAVPLLAMLISDPILGLLHGFRPFTPMTLFVYSSLFINVLIGRVLRASENPLRIAPATLIGSLQFYAITNFAVWLLGNHFPHTDMGLVSCYVVALPFLRNMVLGDLLYSTALFGLHAWLSHRVFPLERVERATAA
jgi:hypothetical protein